MEISSVETLCETLINDAIQRCRMVDDLCRLSVALRQIPCSDPPVVRVSVSDTGAGSSFEDLLPLRYTLQDHHKWDGLISVATTSNSLFLCSFTFVFLVNFIIQMYVTITDISDPQLHYANVNLRELITSRQLIRLPSSSKNGAKFSGTEVSFITSESLHLLLAKITFFLKKMLVFKYPKVAIETLVNCAGLSGLEHDSCILAIECDAVPFSSSYLECMRLGFENYILHHADRRDNVCNSCFPSRDQLKVGVGQLSNSGRLGNRGNILEAVIIISKAQEQLSSSCCMITNDKTEILYFENFIPSSISQSYVEAFTSIKWEKYGLTLKRASNQDGTAVLEWDNLPPQVHIAIALHCYSQQVAEPLYPRNCEVSRSLSRKTIIIALDELKEKNEGVLLSTHAVKICNYAPDLAKTISRLVLLSNDLEFKGECFSLLGIQVEEMQENTVESCIREKIVSAVGMNDMKSQSNKEAASILFDDYSHNMDHLDVDYEDEESNYLDL